MKSLHELVNWVNSVKEFDRVLTEALGHLDHPEDLVLLAGTVGAIEAVDAIEKTSKSPKEITIKWDGYPALIFGRGPDGKFSIMDKHMFNKKGGEGRKVYSPQDFMKYDAARGADRSQLYQVISDIWPSLEAADQGEGYYWGDLLFSQPLKPSADGLFHFRPNPNGIEYTVDPNSDIGKYLSGKKAGIVVHTYLPADAVNTKQATPLNGTIGSLKQDTDVAIVPAKMPVTPNLKIDPALINNANAAISRYGEAVDQLFATAPQSVDAFSNLFTTYINKKIVSKNLKNLVSEFYTYFKNRPMTDSMRAKLTQHFNDNKQGVLGVFAIWMEIYKLKMAIVQQLNKAAETAPIQGYLQDGTRTQEGFVSQGVKFVDRMGFSAQNLAGRTAVAEEQLDELKCWPGYTRVRGVPAGAPGSCKKKTKEDVTEAKDGARKELIIYPGGFHPFHLGHASVYNYLQQEFPSANIYVAATDTTTERPFGFDDKKFLAGQAGVPNNRFVKVKSPYRANEITAAYDPESTVLMFAVSVKDADRFDFKPKKDGSPSYFQPYSSTTDFEPMNKHAYIIIVPKIDFRVLGKTVDSASTIRKMYADGSDDQRLAIANDLYPSAKNIKAVKKLLDKYLAPQLDEADNPDYFGGGSQSPIPGTPGDLMPQPSKEEILQYKKEMADLKRFMGHGHDEY